jgi:hypothetical protein
MATGQCRNVLRKSSTVSPPEVLMAVFTLLGLPLYIKRQFNLKERQV